MYNVHDPVHTYLHLFSSSVISLLPIYLVNISPKAILKARRAAQSGSKQLKPARNISSLYVSDFRNFMYHASFKKFTYLPFSVIASASSLKLLYIADICKYNQWLTGSDSISRFLKILFLAGFCYLVLLCFDNEWCEKSEIDR